MDIPRSLSPPELPEAVYVIFHALKQLVRVLDIGHCVMIIWFIQIHGCLFQKSLMTVSFKRVRELLLSREVFITFQTHLTNLTQLDTISHLRARVESGGGGVTYF